MKKEEIIKRELFNIIIELKANQKFHNETANESIRNMSTELEQLALFLANHSPEEALDLVRRDYFEAVSAEACQVDIP